MFFKWNKENASGHCIICKLFSLFLHIEMFNCLTNALYEEKTKDEQH
jgi:hypothetical protein